MLDTVPDALCGRQPDELDNLAAEGKPLFIWAANGNPLGLT